MTNVFRSHKVLTTLGAGIVAGLFYRAYGPKQPPQRPLSMHDATTVVANEAEAEAESPNDTTR